MAFAAVLSAGAQKLICEPAAQDREMLAGTTLADAKDGSPGTTAFFSAISKQAVGWDRIEIDTQAGPQ